MSISHYCIRKCACACRESIFSLFKFIQTTVKQKKDFLVLGTLSVLAITFSSVLQS